MAATPLKSLCVGRRVLKVELLILEEAGRGPPKLVHWALFGFLPSP